MFKLTNKFFFINGHVHLTTGLGLEWHVYFWLVDLTKMTCDYMSNWTSNQIGQKNDHLGEND
jgi:hypothetical protein